MATDLAEFLRARLNEDEVEGFPRPRHELEALRGILEMHKDCGTGCGFCDDGGHGGDGSCGTLDYLAAIWSDHPDYRPEWKP